MGRLIDEIADFLEGSGIACSRQVRGDFDVICAETSIGKAMKVILPLEISAATQEEAISFSEGAHETVGSISSHEGYPLIITEDRWRSRRSMTEARLLSHLEIFNRKFARNCMVKRIGKAEAQAFLSSAHSYGYAACKYRYGLFSRMDCSLVAVATFSNARRWIKDGKEIRSYEWTRYASLPGMRVCGGMGKLLKAFISEVQPDDIMSYADLEWSEGDVYEALGFVREEGKAPVSFIINPLTYERKAIRNQDSDDPSSLFFRNFGSAKYRLKLTDYPIG